MAMGDPQTIVQTPQKSPATNFGPGAHQPITVTLPKLGAIPQTAFKPGGQKAARRR